MYYSHSPDNGVTWSKNERVTDQLIRRRLGVWSNGFDQLAVFVWDDTRDGDELTHTQDLFSAAAQFQSVGASTSTAWWYGAGAAGGLALVGLVLLLSSRIRSGRAARAAAPSRPLVTVAN